MKLSLNRSLLAALLVSPALYAGSLYDSAPPLGLPSTHLVSYTASVSLGYDDNIDSTTVGRVGSAYTSFSVSAAASDQSNVTKYNYQVSLGGTVYDKEATGNNDRAFSNSSANLSLTHQFDARSSYSASININYSLEPNYADGMSAAQRQGNALAWSLSNSYSRTLDPRWSWTATAGYSGTIYDNKDYSTDDREYVSLSAVTSYKHSTLTSYRGTVSTSYDIRTHGLDSSNIRTLLGIESSLSDYSSVSFDFGAQFKFIDGGLDVYPNAKGSYRYKHTDDITSNIYLSLSNENTDTYRNVSNEYSADYLSNMTLRLGAQMTQRFYGRFNGSCGVDLMNSSYSEGTTKELKDEDRVTTNLRAGISYSITQDLRSSINYTYTLANNDAGDYYRNNISASLTYTF